MDFLYLFGPSFPEKPELFGMRMRWLWLVTRCWHLQSISCLVRVEAKGELTFLTDWCSGCLRVLEAEKLSGWCALCSGREQGAGALSVGWPSLRSPFTLPSGAGLRSTNGCNMWIQVRSLRVAFYPSKMKLLYHTVYRLMLECLFWCIACDRISCVTMYLQGNVKFL